MAITTLVGSHISAEPPWIELGSVADAYTIVRYNLYNEGDKTKELTVIPLEAPSMVIPLGCRKVVLPPHGRSLRKSVLVRAAGLLPGQHSTHVLFEDAANPDNHCMALAFAFKVTPNSVFRLSASPVPIRLKQGGRGVEIANFSDVPRTLVFTEKRSIQSSEGRTIELVPRAVQIVEYAEIKEHQAEGQTAVPEITLLDTESGRIYVVPSIGKHLWFTRGSESSWT